MNSCACCTVKIESLQNTLNRLEREFLLLQAKLQELGEQNGVNLKGTLKRVETTKSINTSDFEDDSDEQTNLIGNRPGHNKSGNGNLFAEASQQVKIGSYGDDDSDEFGKEDLQFIHGEGRNSIEECFTWALTQTEEADKLDILRNQLEADVIRNEDLPGVETSASLHLKIERRGSTSDVEDSDDSEDAGWQCIYCKDWNSIEEYFCFTCALTQTEEAYQQNRLGKHDFTEYINVESINDDNFNDDDDEDSDGSEDEEWQCMHCRDWSSYLEYFCFTCALTQTI